MVLEIAGWLAVQRRRVESKLNSHYYDGMENWQKDLLRIIIPVVSTDAGSS
jgi:hypothetical protein